MRLFFIIISVDTQEESPSFSCRSSFDNIVPSGVVLSSTTQKDSMWDGTEQKVINSHGKIHYLLTVLPVL